MVEQGDSEALLERLAEPQEKQGDEAPRIEIWAGVDVETVIERFELPSREEFVEWGLHQAGPTIRVLQFIVAFLQLSHDPKGKLLNLAEQHLAAMQAFVESAEAEREAKKRL